MDNLHNRLTSVLGKKNETFATARKRILRLVKLQLNWWRTVVKYGKYSLLQVKFAENIVCKFCIYFY